MCLSNTFLKVSRSLREEKKAVEQLYVTQARPDSKKAHKSVDINKYYGNNVSQFL